MYNSPPITYASFNSRTREGCDCINLFADRKRSGFNSRTREGCDLFNDYGFANGNVSIHAPARGAITQGLDPTLLCLFQFTHPRGVRYAVEYHLAAVVVSIHAPARGAMPS